MVALAAIDDQRIATLNELTAERIAVVDALQQELAAVEGWLPE